MMNDPSKGSYFRGQILLSAKMLTQKETASMNLPITFKQKSQASSGESSREQDRALRVSSVYVVVRLMF